MITSTALSFMSNNPSCLVSGSSDQTLRVWNVAQPAVGVCGKRALASALIVAVVATVVAAVVPTVVPTAVPRVVAPEQIRHYVLPVTYHLFPPLQLVTRYSAILPLGYTFLSLAIGDQV